MNDNIATLCIIAFGVGLLILFAGALLLSVLRGSIFGLGMMVMRMISEQPAEETKVDLTTLPHADTQNLRAQAQSLDFDSAVNKYKSQPLQPKTTGTPSPFPTAQTDLEPRLDPGDTTSSRRRRRRGADEDAEGDEMFGGFLDDIDPFQ